MIKVVVIREVFWNENHQCSSENERPWYILVAGTNVLCSSMDGRGSAAIRNCSHISETQHSKNLVLAHATTPEEAGREFCSFYSLRGPRRGRSISPRVSMIILLGEMNHHALPFESLLWGDTTIDISLAKASYLSMPNPKAGKKCHPGKRLEKYLKQNQRLPYPFKCKHTNKSSNK